MMPEIAIIGRSNAGKSTLINGIGNARIALVSSTPGKTRMLNFYQSERYRLVDMPGYGFARRAPDEQAKWQTMIEPYLAARANLVGLLIVMDIRRDWSEDEKNLLKWLAPRQLPAAVVLTKADKLARTVAQARVREIHQQSGVEHVMMCSWLKKEGYSELEDFVYLEWIKPAREQQK